ncbi:MAG: putative phage abortive infection protein [Campylobacterales bacterium]|nr:putative phage abortive infection protein [Campylobacterales bacterium]
MFKSNKDKLSKLKYLIPGAFAIFFSTVAFYGYHFPYGLSHNQQDWGTFGDFMGGTLNPIFALFSLVAILYTIKIQTEELELSREELKATREELAKSSKAQQEQSDSFKIQNDSMKLQSFENTFFQLMNLFLQTREHLTMQVGNSTVYASKMDKSKVEINDSEENYICGELRFQTGKYFSFEAIKMYIVLLKKVYEVNYDAFNEKYEGYTGTYCIQIYQILKFIDNSQIYDKQFYVNLLRAQLSKEELEFLFYHCLGSIGEQRFKPLVEQFEFFEHLVLNDEIQKKLTWYAESAFGKNESILLEHKRQKEKMESQDGDY